MKFYTPFKISENIRETPEGYLLCLAVPIARTGWQEYAEGECPLEPGPDGIVRVYRDAKEVFRPVTIASYAGKSITIKHPNDFVTPNNWKDLTKGTIQNPRKGEEPDEDGQEQLVADLLVTDSMAIQLVKNGLREVSCGYEAEYEQTGEGEGRQYNIIGNHVALVEDGRAGSSYAIKDHNGKANMNKFEKAIEKLKARFGAKVVDEAMAEEKKEESKDEGAYDEMMEKVSDFMQKVETLLENKKAKDDSEKKDDKKEGDDKAKDEDEAESEDDDGEEMKIEERIKALEAAVAKLLESKDAEGEEGEESQSEDDAEESEESEDEESEESEDEESELTGDSARLEILAPGIKPIAKEKPEDTKKRALVTAFGTKDGREVISSLTGSKKLVLDSAEKVQMLFMSASEVLKARRGTGLEGTKDGEGFKSKDGETVESPMTPEKMNEINAQHWGNKK